MEKKVTIPLDLKNDMEQNRCILFVGAGASMDAVDGNGQPLPHWGQLLEELLTMIQNSAEPDSGDVVNEIQNMLRWGDFMPLAEWIDFRLGDSKFRNHLMNRLLTAKTSNVHSILSKKPFRAVITTNYDRLVEIYWEKEGKNPFVVIPQRSDSIATAIDSLQTIRDFTSILRIHGSISDPASLIFFPRTYREIMFNNDSFRQFMSQVFRQFTVLFVGTSFRDPNLQSLLQWVYTITKGSEREHYAILDSRGTVFKKYMKSNYNINFITYDAPNGNHSNLIPLLESI
jgi:hypothetical protein